MSYLLGIDLGTSSIKVVLLDPENLKITNSASRDYHLYYPCAGHVEQSPQEWWSATVSAIRELMQKYPHIGIAGIGFSGQMHGTVLLGDNGEILHPAIIWADQRSKNVLPELLDIPDYVHITGTRPAAGFMAATLLWIKKHQPELLAQVKHVILPKDYLRFRMSGEIGTDISDASATGLFDIQDARWSQEIISSIGLSEEIFPPLSKSYEIVGHLQQDVAQELGLKMGIPIVAGSADQAAQAIGNGILSVGRLSITLGSGGQVFSPLGKQLPLLTDERIHIFNHAITGHYALGAILSAGLSLRWLRDWLNLSDDEHAYTKLEQSASHIPAGSDGLLFLPYLNGERTPHMNPDARGSFIGLTSRHTEGHLVRSVMEGVAFAMRQTYEICTSVVHDEIHLIVGAGGGMNSHLWRQIMVNMLNQPIYQSRQFEQSSLGAALLAGIGMNLFADSLEPSISYLETALGNYDSVTEPGPNGTIYDERYQLFKELYPLLNIS